ncbi:MAG TPA: diguanylate cyclase, partial [Azospira sp.]|nr:diguanylate cyclase [Azospira sp.]
MEVETSTGAVAATPGQRPSSPAGGYGVVLLVGIILLGGCLLGIMLGQLDAERRESEARARTLAELATVRARLEGTVQATFNLTAGIVHLLRQDGDISPQRFAGMAAQAIDSARYIRNITLAPDDVIRLIYPLEGNEKAIGTDFRRIPAQYPTIQRAREINQPILAGPVDLVQGGRGLIHRRPVFIPDPKGPPRYWGAASMVADVDKVMAAGGLSQDGELNLALRGADGKGEQGGLIWGDGAVFAQQPATMTVQIPGGTWQLAAVPKSGWPATSLLASPYFLLTLINTGLVALFVGQLGRRNQLIRRRNADLQQEVQERQRVQTSLMDSEERFRKLFDLSPDATWVMRNRAFLDWNAAALSLFGVADKAEALATAPLRFSPAQQPDGADSAQQAEAMIQAAVIRGLHRFDWQFCRADGQPFPAEVTLCPMILGGEKLMYAVIRDISERQAAREALERSQSLLFGIVDNAPSLIYVFDTLGRLQLCNRGFESAVGHPREAIVGHPREHFLAPLAAREHRQNDLAVMASGQPMRFEEQNLEAGGNHVYLTAKCPLVGADGNIQAVIGISTDITELRHTTDQLRLAGVVLESTADGVMITDPQGRIVSVNRAFTDITGYSAEEAIGQRSSLLRSEHQPPDFYQQMWHSIQEAGVWHGEIWNRRKNGELYPEWLTINAIYGDGRQILNYVGVFSDISTIKHSQAELERLAHFDPLTELPNRTLFHDRLQHALERSQRYGQDLAVLLLDLDGFKTVNDSLGHPMGDLLLCQAAQRFKQCLRVEDTVARLGGDEFAIILNNLGQETDAVAVVKKLLQALQEPFDLEGTSALVTTSIGIAIAPMDGQTTEELVRNADAAMYGAKEGGRNNYRFYQSEMTRRAQERLSQERALRRALEEGEFEVWYQPKLDL